MTTKVEKWDAIVAANADPRLEANDVRVAIAVASHMGRDGAWPAQSTVAERVGVSVRTVRSSLKRLVTTGYFVVAGHPRGGRGLPTVYRLATAPRQPSEPSDAGPDGTTRDAETRKPVAAFDSEKEEARCRVSEAETRQPSAVNPAMERQKPGNPLPTKQNRTSFEPEKPKPAPPVPVPASDGRAQAHHDQQSDTPAVPRSPAKLREFEDRVLDAAKLDPARWMGNFGMIAAWKNAGCTEGDILAGIETVASRPGFTPKANLNYFRQAIEEARDMRKAAEARGVPAPLGGRTAAGALAERRAAYGKAIAAAKANGLEPGKPGWPKAADYGLVWGDGKIELVAGWTPSPSPETSG